MSLKIKWAPLLCSISLATSTLLTAIGAASADDDFDDRHDRMRHKGLLQAT